MFIRAYSKAKNFYKVLFIVVLALLALIPLNSIAQPVQTKGDWYIYGYNGVYDGANHSSYVVIEDTEKYSVKYFDNSGAELSTVPTQKNAGNYTYKAEIWVNGEILQSTITLRLDIEARDVNVKIAGNSLDTYYDGRLQSISGWQIKETSIPTVSGAATPTFDTGTISCSNKAVAKGASAAEYSMGLKSSDFSCSDTNFDVNYIITDGKLNIKPRDVTINVRGQNAKYTYDGQEKSISGWIYLDYKVKQIPGLADAVFSSYYIDITRSEEPEAKGINVGSYYMNLKSDEFICTDTDFNASFNVVSDGTLTIEPRTVHITIEGNKATKTYNGKEQSVEGWTVTKAEVEKVGAASGYTKWAEDNTPKFDTSDIQAEGEFIAKGTDVGTYEMPLMADFFYCTNDNFYPVYEEIVSGSLTIDPVDGVVVTIKGNSGKYTYDGDTKQVNGYTATYSNSIYTVNDYVMTGDAAVSAKKVGTYNMGLSADQFQNTNTNFTNVKFKVIDGKLTIEKPVAKVAKNKETPRTGDDSSFMLLALACAAVAGASLVVTVRKRRKE
jgi:LPXTG-motif cell wall-anchored protein